MSTQIKYAYKRHNTWVYRKTYPKHLQAHLGSSLKQSLKTSNATEAKARVAELNQTYQSIVKEAEANVSAHTDKAATDIHTGALGYPVVRPRYQPLRLLGDRRVGELAAEYLSQQAERLRPGSYKAVRFAITLLTSECAEHHIGTLTTVTGREVVSLIGALSPNIRKYKDGKGASLQDLARLSQHQAHPSDPIPYPKAHAAVP